MDTPCRMLSLCHFALRSLPFPLKSNIPKGMDANECALKVQPAAKSLGILLNQAAWLSTGSCGLNPGTPTVDGRMADQGVKTYDKRLYEAQKRLRELADAKGVWCSS